MNQNLTEVVIILDRSGSMRNLAADTIGGFNSFVDVQKKEVGDARLTAVLFDDRYEVLHDGVDIQDVPILTENEYSARGMTAMLDAIGKTINDVGDRLSKTKEEERPGKVIFVITTDGQENSSREFTKTQIKEMIELQQNKYNWNFLFLGANIDSFSEADSIGISKNLTANYKPSMSGTSDLYDSVSAAVSSVRRSEKGKVASNWSDKLNKKNKR